MVSSTPDQVVQLQALAGIIALCFLARHFTLTVPLSTQEYKQVLTISWSNLTECWGVNCHGQASYPGGSGHTPSHFMLQKMELSAESCELVGFKRLYFFHCLNGLLINAL